MSLIKYTLIAITLSLPLAAENGYRLVPKDIGGQERRQYFGHYEDLLLLTVTLPNHRRAVEIYRVRDAHQPQLLKTVPVPHDRTLYNATIAEAFHGVAFSVGYHDQTLWFDLRRSAEGFPATVLEGALQNLQFRKPYALQNSQLVVATSSGTALLDVSDPYGPKLVGLTDTQANKKIEFIQGGFRLFDWSDIYDVTIEAFTGKEEANRIYQVGSDDRGIREIFKGDGFYIAFLNQRSGLNVRIAVLDARTDHALLEVAYQVQPFTSGLDLSFTTLDEACYLIRHNNQTKQQISFNLPGVFGPTEPLSQDELFAVETHALGDNIFYRELGLGLPTLYEKQNDECVQTYRWFNHSGSAPFHIHGDLLYSNVYGGSFEIYNLNQGLQQPHFLHYPEISGHQFKKLFIAEDTLIGVTDFSIVLFDLTQPESPTLETVYYNLDIPFLTEQPYYLSQRVRFEDGYLYFREENVLYRWNPNDRNFSAVQHWPLDPSRGHSWDYQMVDGYLFEYFDWVSISTYWRGVALFPDGTTEEVISSPFGVYHTHFIWLQDVFYLMGMSMNDVYDMSNPSSPTLVNYIPHVMLESLETQHRFFDEHTLLLSGGYSHHGKHGFVEMLDTSNVLSPQLVNRIRLNPEDVTVWSSLPHVGPQFWNNQVYTADSGGIKVLDLVACQDVQTWAGTHAASWTGQGTSVLDLIPTLEMRCND